GQFVVRLPAGPDELTADLVAVARTATCLGPGRGLEGLEEALEGLRCHLGAEVAELFLRAPGEMVLTACSAHQARLFWEHPLFALGQGFPGLVADTGQPLVCRHLASDPRYLRRGPRRYGISSYACVPIPGEEGVMGSLQVAWKGSQAPLERAARLLGWVAVPLATALQAYREGLRRQVARCLAGGNPGERLVECLRLAARADWAALARGETSCGDPRHCPCRRAGQPLVRWGARQGWPRPCRALAGACGLCLPALGGVLQLRYARPPRPPTRHLAGVLEMVREAEQALGELAPEKGAGGLRVDPAQVTGPPAPLWEIRCLGSFEIRREGRPLPPEAFPRRQALALLKILLLYPDVCLGREVLCEHLWPDLEADAAANRLYGLVHSLRQVLEPRARERDWQILGADSGGYCLRSGPLLRVDLHRYRQLVRQGLGARQEGRAQQALALLGEASTLYRGDLFADDPYAEWCWMEREELRQRHLEVLKARATLSAEAGDLEGSLDCLRQALRIDPLREDLHAGCIEVLLGLGRRAEALAQYEQCERLVRQELQAEPLPETRRLRERILASLGRL
ncbi:MAG TPA: BTAD domain-containing putative transcriptional regulator, partial [Candidatus Nitrosotenuis sp.]|nr:BTAD domain-containing putative transcriptional regulator [Candidatus Nitrosotenuis sp.]